MPGEPSVWRAVRWPLLLMVVALVGIGAAVVLELTPAREYALTVGAPSLWFLLPIAVLWLIVAIVVHAIRRRAR